MIMSDVGWTLWAAIQARISTIDYDFTGWAEERWARRARRRSMGRISIVARMGQDELTRLART